VSLFIDNGSVQDHFLDPFLENENAAVLLGR
jgi:hypothetical protein